MFPLMKFRVEEESMSPTLESGDYLIVNKWSKKFLVGDIVVFNYNDRFFVKRIKKISKDGKFFLEGDNQDSRSFDFIEEKNILGKVMFKF